MTAAWAKILDRVLRPERPRFARCDDLGRAHAEIVRAGADERAHALVECEKRIEVARADVFANGDGVVGARMTELEREWRTLHRRAAADDGALRDLWSAIAPRAWIDGPRYRDSDPSVQLAAAVALASDPAGVERAEAAAAAFASALAPWHANVRSSRRPSRVRWHVAAVPVIEDTVVDHCVNALAAVAQAVAQSDAAPLVFERARRLRRDVMRAARQRAIVTRGRSLPRELAHVAFVDFLWNAATSLSVCVPGDAQMPGAPIAAFANPATPLMEIWSAGYVLCAMSEDRVVLGARIGA